MEAVDRDPWQRVQMASVLALQIGMTRRDRGVEAGVARQQDLARARFRTATERIREVADGDAEARLEPLAAANHLAARDGRRFVREHAMAHRVRADLDEARRLHALGH